MYYARHLQNRLANALMINRYHLTFPKTGKKLYIDKALVEENLELSG